MWLHNSGQGKSVAYYCCACVLSVLYSSDNVLLQCAGTVTVNSMWSLSRCLLGLCTCTLVRRWLQADARKCAQAFLVGTGSACQDRCLLHVDCGHQADCVWLHLFTPSKTCDSAACCVHCRHGFLLAAVNMPVGEKWAYAICLLHIVMAIHNVWPFLSLYDIACKWAPHFRQFVSESSGWEAWLRAWALGMPMPLPPFHSHMHSPECAEQNSLKRIAGAGRGNGEPTEIFNRFLGMIGPVLQYASKHVRVTWLSVQIQEWRRKKEEDLPALLVRMLSRARVELAVYLGQQEQLLEEARKCFPEERVSIALC